jgi:RNA polymerase sigma-70 factor, ECF subfamily
VDPTERAQLQVWMQRLAEGDREAFGPVFSRVHPAVVKFTRAALGDVPDADDVAQEALLKLFSQAARFNSRGDALGWALTLAAFECRSHRRRKMRRREACGVDLELRAEGDLETAVARQQLSGALEDVLSTLPAEDRATLRALLDEARPCVAPATFRKRVQRSVERLRAAWRLRHGAS